MTLILRYEPVGPWSVSFSSAGSGVKSFMAPLGAGTRVKEFIGTFSEQPRKVDAYRILCDTFRMLDCGKLLGSCHERFCAIDVMSSLITHTGTSPLVSPNPVRGTMFNAEPVRMSSFCLVSELFCS